MLKFRCLKCGRCCHEVAEIEEDPTYKRIPLYPEEADRLEAIARERQIPLRIIEDVVFPDEKNKKILVLTWRILLDNEGKVCPFHDPKVGCTIHENKPLSCQAYPLAIKTEDAFNMKISIDPLCNYTIKYRDQLEDIDFEALKEIYDEELALAQNLLKRNKRAILSLRGKELLGELKIQRKISIEAFDSALKDWDRITLE